jgi:hypothetical protein
MADWASEVLLTVMAPLLIVIFPEPSVEATAVNLLKEAVLLRASHHLCR